MHGYQEGVIVVTSSTALLQGTVNHSPPTSLGFHEVCSTASFSRQRGAGSDWPADIHKIAADRRGMGGGDKPPNALHIIPEIADRLSRKLGDHSYKSKEQAPGRKLHQW